MSTNAGQKPFIHVEILDFSRDPVLLKEAAAYYCSLSPDRATWSEEKRRRLAIRTECRWARVPVGEQVFMLSELGDGPREPLSKSNVAQVKFYAEIRPSTPGGDDGFLEAQPFCQIQFDDDGCRRLRTQGLLKLEEFIRRTVPECAKALEEWQTILLAAKSRYLEIKAARAPRTSVPAGTA
jgi:hypothetical protein